MLKLRLSQVRARCWKGYYKNTSGWLPKRMSWMEPEAAVAFRKMTEACDHRIEFTDVYRSARTQMLAIQSAAPKKKRLYAPPTKSGHNFAFSVDVSIDNTLKNFRKSGISELIVAGRDRQSLGRWMKQFGWTGISTEAWHFNYLQDHPSTVKKIAAVYGDILVLENADVQRALNMLLGKKLPEPLAIDGILGPKSSEAALLAQSLVGYADNGSFDPWFRRLLAGATVTIEEV